MRTSKNLDYVIRAYNSGEEGVHVVTQLFNSLLSLIVVPWAGLVGKQVWDVKLVALKQNGWPMWEITIGNTKTLRELILRLRNAISHWNVAFSSDSRQLSNVEIEVWTDKNHQTNWKANMNGELLLQFCHLLSDRINVAIENETDDD